MASVTVNLPGYFDSTTQGLIAWTGLVPLGSTFDDGGALQTLNSVQLTYQGGNEGRVAISMEGTNTRFTPAFEATGRIIFTASDDETLEVMIANADMTEPYQWVPTNSAEVITFTNHVRGLTDHTTTLTLTDDPPGPVNVAPSFADDTGDAQTWEMGTAITAITVPEADGEPTPHLCRRGRLARWHRL